jgi:opacity protein-like surface antigen
MKKIVAFASAMLAFGVQAKAADLYQPEPAPQVVEQPVAASANGWYLRGDLSYDIVNMKGAHYFTDDSGVLKDFDTTRINNTGNLGVGIGYQVNDYLRVDKTFDYMFRSQFRGTTHGLCGNPVQPCNSRDVSHFSAYSLMANAYVDIYKWGIVTPYVGAGIGGTYVMWDKLNNTDADGSFDHGSRKSWRFTYALMAGASIDVNCQVKADIGYRYRNVAGGDMFGFSTGAGPGYDKGFDIHEFRTGVRYALGGDSCQTAYLPPADIPTTTQPVFK